MIDYIWSFFICFLYCARILLLKYRNRVSHLKNRYHYAKVVENAKTNFLISPYCALLFSRKKNFNFFEVALSAVVCNGRVGRITNVWGYHHWNTANSTLDIYLLFDNGHEITHTSFNVYSNLTKCTTAIDFCLTSVFFINPEHLSHPTLVLLFILWKGKFGWTFCQNNTVMLT